MPSPEPLVYLSGQFLPQSQASLAIFDAGIVLGATVTDLTRTFQHKPFRLEDHIDRFYRSCKYARIEPQIDRRESLRTAEKVIESRAKLMDEKDDLSLVQFITPGELSTYAGMAGASEDMTPTYCMHTFPLAFSRWQHYYTEGVHVVTPSIRQVPAQCVDPKMKCRSRMHWWLAENEAHLVDPKAVPLCLDLDGNVTETSGSNFIIVQDGTVISPSPRQILWGVSLKTVEELCAQLKIPFLKRDLQVHDVVNADEAMLVSTPYCLAPVTRINGISIGPGPSGPIFERLIGAWSDRVGFSIVDQILTQGAN